MFIKILYCGSQRFQMNNGARGASTWTDGRQQLTAAPLCSRLLEIGKEFLRLPWKYQSILQLHCPQKTLAGRKIVGCNACGLWRRTGEHMPILGNKRLQRGCDASSIRHGRRTDGDGHVTGTSGVSTSYESRMVLILTEMLIS